MLTPTEVPTNPSSSQATELYLLVDLEARWENLRVYQSMAPTSLKELHQKQKAYEAFFTKLVAYNKSYKPPHVPELLLNNPQRLKIWCRRMRDLLLRVQSVSVAHYPVHLLEKAYRWADRLAERIKQPHITRPAVADNTPAAIRELEDLIQWCDSLPAAQAVAG